MSDTDIDLAPSRMSIVELMQRIAMPAFLFSGALALLLTQQSCSPTSFGGLQPTDRAGLGQEPQFWLAWQHHHVSRASRLRLAPQVASRDVGVRVSELVCNLGKRRPGSVEP